MKYLNFWLLGAILVLSTIIRLYQLGKVPASPDWDEVSLGYNAYSILKTGKDEYGTFLPLSLRSYNDYKPPFTTYILIPSIALFGLSTWAVRFPSAVFGVLSVLGTYFLARSLLDSGNNFSTHKKFGSEIYKLQSKDNFIQFVPYIATFLMAISPWHIQFSRVAFEANFALTLVIWGITFFFIGMKKPICFYISAILLSLSLYAYHSERLFVPLLLFFYSVIYIDKLKLLKKYIFFSLFIGITICIPLAFTFIGSTSLTRLQGTSSLADQTGLLARSVRKLEKDRMAGDLIGEMFENRRIVWAKTIINGYVSHFSIKWLFLTGDANPRHHAPDMGLLYLWELPFFLIGLFWIARFRNRVSYSLFFWIILAPVAASPTTELPHAVRTLVFLPSLQIVIAVGIYGVLQNIRKIRLLFAGVSVVIVIFMILSLLQYADLYFSHMNIEYSRYWQYGYEEAVKIAHSREDKYSKIVVSPKLEQPHMFFLYYLLYDPVHYLENGGTNTQKYGAIVNSFGKYEFRTIIWDKEIHDGRILYIGLPEEIAGTPIRSINYLDGTEAIKIAE